MTGTEERFCDFCQTFDPHTASEWASCQADLDAIRWREAPEDHFRACALMWSDGWATDHVCTLGDGHDGDHRCACDATHHEWNDEDDDGATTDRHRAETKDGY